MADIEKALVTRTGLHRSSRIPTSLYRTSCVKPNEIPSAVRDVSYP